MFFKYLIFLGGFIICSNAFSQEFNVTVKVQAPRLTVADPRLMQQMEQTIADFYNKARWTGDEFMAHEKIEANLVINIKNDMSPNSFSADFTFQSLRPAYNSNYKTQTFNWIDRDYNFVFEEMQPLNFSTNVFIDDLTAILTFYGYLILGLDYDSFSNFGGTDHFNKARDVLDNVPLTNQNIRGWNSQGRNNNRYWLIENLTNPRFGNFRHAFYEYHRMSLDVMSEDSERGRAIITSTLREMKNISDLSPQNPLITLFINAKKIELIEIFKPAGYAQRNSVYTALSELDPTGIEEYREIIR
jgi:hypothetical protein